MVSILSPYSEESDGLGHERGRMTEASTDQCSTKTRRGRLKPPPPGQRTFSWFSGISWFIFPPRLHASAREYLLLQSNNASPEHSRVPLRKSYVFYVIPVAKIHFQYPRTRETEISRFPLRISSDLLIGTLKRSATGQKKAATSFREAAAYYTGKNLLSHGMLPHYHRRLGA